MADIAGVLLVPAKGDPLGLLREGPCGARPPVAHAVMGAIARGWRTEIEGIWMAGPMEDYVRMSGFEGMPRVESLVLAWDGEPLPDACFHADPSGFGWDARLREVDAMLHGVPAKWGGHPGTLIFVDADGREVPRV